MSYPVCGQNEIVWFYVVTMHPKDADRMTNIEGSDLF